MKPDTKILRGKLGELLKTASKDKEAYSSLANILGQVGETLAARAENGDAEAVIALGKIGVSFAGMFQKLSMMDHLHRTEYTRPFYEAAAFAPGLVSDETGNEEQLKFMVKLGEKWSPYRTWKHGRKRLNFSRGAPHIANRVAQIIYAKPGIFKTTDEAFKFGFDQLVAEHGGKKIFVEFFDGPRNLAKSVIDTKGSGRRAQGEKNLPASIAVQMAEVKSKVKRVFDTIYIPRK